MRILHVSAGLDAALGGPPTCVASSAVAAAKAGNEITVVFPHRDSLSALDEPAAQTLLRNDIRVRAFELTCSGRLAPWAISLPLIRWLWKNTAQYDTVHVHSAWALSSLAAVLIARYRRRAVVLSPHESLTRFDLSHAKLPGLRLIKRLLHPLYRRATSSVVFSSGLERRDSSTRSRRTPFGVVIPHTVSETPVARPPDQRAGSLCVGYLGRLHPKKNVDVLLTALSDLPASVTARIAGAGSASYESRLRALAATLEIDSRVAWLGFVDGYERSAFFASIDVLVMPSRYECFGMAAAEAMAAGIPVIVAPSTGIAETVLEYDAGIVVDPTPTAIVAALQNLCTQPYERARLAENGIKAAAGALSPESHGRELRKLYENVIAASR